MPNRVGQQIGNYRLTHFLGAGGYAEVYQGEHIFLGSQAAIKLLHTHVAESDIAQFQQEGRTLALLTHPNIVRILDFGLDQHKPYLVMDYAPGGTLRGRHPRGSRIDLPTVVTYAKQIGQALQYAHERRLIHRDIKPENMLVGHNGEILLSDFGVASIAQSTHHEIPQDAVGTAAYMSPEQIQGKPRLASDQYALAIVVYEWLSGNCPFQGTFIELCSQHLFAVPAPLVIQVTGLAPAVEQVILTALAKKTEERFASVSAFVEALEQASLTSQIAPQTLVIAATEAPTPSLALPPLGARESIEAARVTPILSYPPIIPDNHVPAPSLSQPTKDTPVQSQPINRHLVRQYNEPSPTIHSSPTIRTNSNAPVTSMRQPRRWLLPTLTIVLILVLIGSGVAILQHTAVSAPHQSIQPTTTLVAKKTAPATTDEYGDAVAQHGVMYGFNAEHTHANPYEHILTRTNVSGLRQQWVATTGDKVSSSPAVANGLVFVGSNDNKLYAFDATTGQQKWAVTTGYAITSSPAVANGLVFVGSNDNKLYAFDAATGQQKWAATAGDWISTSPVVTDGLVFVGSDDHSLYAFDTATGQQKWVVTTGDLVRSSPAVANGLVYVGSVDHNLYAIDAKSGRQKWASATRSSIFSSPAVANGLVYVGSGDYDLYAFDAATGQQKWVAPTGNVIYSSPAVANGLVFVGSDDHNLYAFDAATGQQKWMAPTGNVIHAAPTLANGLVFVGSGDHKLYAFDAATGQQKWVTVTGDQISSSPTVANGFVYIGSDDHKLYAYALGKSG